MRKLLPAACLFSMLLPQGLLLMGSESGPGQFTVDGSSQPAQAAISPTKEGIPISIAPEKIIEILQKQPGLTYTIKKILADLALQQGRLLDENSFSDSTLFYLIQSDENIRAIVTTQLIRRKYIDVLPTDEEAEREYLRQRRMQAELSRAARSNSVDEQADYSVSDPERRIGAETHQYARPSENCSPGQSGKECGGSASDQRDRSSPAQQGLDSTRGLPPVQASELPLLLRRTSTGSQPSSDMLSPGLLGSLPEPALPSEREQLNSNYKGSRSLGDRSSTESAFPIEDSLVLRRSKVPYASIPALVDLYAQVDRNYNAISRFGTGLFAAGNERFRDQLPIDMPAGSEYVVGPGDGLNLEIWGGSAAQRVQRVVDREGRISLPEAGLVQVSGKSLADVQHIVQGALRGQFRDIQADVSLARLRTIRVYVVGDVKNPGPYDISSLSTPLNAVLAAGGPTAAGSYRLFRHYRGKQQIQQVDIYDLILNGVRSDLKNLQPGDTVLVPPVGSEVTIEGMVRRPAIYELDSESNLSQVLVLAGGVLPSGTLRHVTVERIAAHQSRTMLSLDIPEAGDADTTKALEEFKIQAGDKIRVAPILPYAEKTVYLDGHVFHPGKYPLSNGMRVSDLIEKYGTLLPEPARQYAEVIRLNPPDLRPEIHAFNLGRVLENKDEKANILLQPFDTVRIFSRFDFEDSPTVSVNGEVRDPGVHRTNGDLTLRDAIYLAGGLTPDADVNDAQVFRNANGKAEFFNVNLARAMAGEAAANILLRPRDRVFVHRSLLKIDPPTASIRGEVATPGRFLLAPGMTVMQLLQLAGGVKRSAYAGNADLERYSIAEGHRVTAGHQRVDLAAIAAGSEEDIPLKDGDVLTIPQINGFEDIGATVTLRGEVAHPGTYGISPGERLSSVLRRAGGFSPLAYPYGSVLTRKNLREMEQKNRAELIQRLQQEVAGANLGSGSQIAQRQAVLLQENQALQRLQSAPALGRQVVRITTDTTKWIGTSDDIMLQAGDTLVVPKRPDVVLITGEVYNPNALTYTPNHKVSWYLKRAGGVTQLGNRKGVFVVRADGSVMSRDSGLFFHSDVMDYVLHAGDTVVVPQRVTGPTALKTFSDTATLLSSLAIAAKVAISF